MPEVVIPLYERIVADLPNDAQAIVVLANAYWLTGRGPEYVEQLAVRAKQIDSANRGACIGHHNTLGDFVSIGPGAVTGGSCRIGTGAFLGVGATLAPEVAVGANAVVGAGAVVVEDVPDGAVVVGNPARTLRNGPGHGGVSVPAAR